MTIDPESGVVRVERYTVVDDFGAVINPILRGWTNYHRHAAATRSA